MRVYIPLIDESEQRCPADRRNRNCTTSNSSNDDRDKKPSIEIINRKVFAFHSDSDVTTSYFIE
jgi:hypothetical protein